jgi:predicted transcriptional regulator
MKTRPLRIEIVPAGELAGHAIRIVRQKLAASKAGNAPEPHRRLVFDSLDDMRRFLTPARLELLKVIRREKPASVYALAKLADRDRKSVTDDLAVLTELGLVTMTKSKGPGRARSVPHVSYSRIEIGVEV